MKLTYSQLRSGIGTGKPSGVGAGQYSGGGGGNCDGTFVGWADEGGGEEDDGGEHDEISSNGAGGGGLRGVRCRSDTALRSGVSGELHGRKGFHSIPQGYDEEHLGDTDGLQSVLPFRIARDPKAPGTGLPLSVLWRQPLHLLSARQRRGRPWDLPLPSYEEVSPHSKRVGGWLSTGKSKLAQSRDKKIPSWADRYSLWFENRKPVFLLIFVSRYLTMLVTRRWNGRLSFFLLKLFLFFMGSYRCYVRVNVVLLINICVYKEYLFSIVEVQNDVKGKMRVDGLAL